MADEPLTRTCSACRQNLPLSAFTKNRSAKDGLAYRCRSCSSLSMKRSAEKHPHLHRRGKLRRRYGMTIEAFDALFTIQNESCAVCLAELPLWRDRHVDHCHTTGRVRGILCGYCNRAIGCAKENPKALRAMADYLEDSRL